MGRPVIGLTTYADETRFGIHDTYSAVLPYTYIRAVHASGGRAVLIPPDDTDLSGAPTGPAGAGSIGPEILDRLDGIVFTGGSDMDPALYGQEPHATTLVKPVRDRAEVMLMRAAIDRDLPVLGVCRGLQLMALAYGGALHQHLPEALGHETHRPTSGPRYGRHPVRLAAGSLCNKILGDEIEVNSFHHQGLASTGTLTASGWCPDDNLVEAGEDPSKRFVLGVQWHPEDSTDHRVFAALVEAARPGR